MTADICVESVELQNGDVRGRNCYGHLVGSLVDNKVAVEPFRMRDAYHYVVSQSIKSRSVRISQLQQRYRLAGMVDHPRFGLYHQLCRRIAQSTLGAVRKVKR